jgi:ABC-type protease/lipase transport system fused ATPase/permease subunit
MPRATNPLRATIRSCRSALGATFILSLFINASMLVSPIYSMQVYDRVLTSRNMGTLALLTVIVVAFLALYGLLEYARSGVLVRTALYFESALRRPLFETMLKAELSPRNRPGQQIIRDAELLRESIAGGIASALCDLPWMPVYILLCFVLHPLLGFVALIGAATLITIALITNLSTAANAQETAKLNSEAHGIAASALRNGEVVRGLGMGDIVLDSGGSAREERHHAGADQVRPPRDPDRAAVRGSVAGDRRYRLARRHARLLGRDGASAGASRAAHLPVEKLVACRAAYVRLQQVFEMHPLAAAPAELPPPNGCIEVESAVVWPPLSQRPVVKYVSFSLQPGECVAVLGASGSGKSSLARALAGVWPLADGSIRIDGASYAQWDANKLGKHIGYLPQDVDLFTGSIAENIARLDCGNQQAVVAAAQLAGVHEAILRLPKGYDTRIGDGEVALSGGMRQRIGLARALYGNPRLIVLDEPNSNLDEEGERALAGAIEKLKVDRRTVVVITHRPAALVNADRVMIMSLGQIVAIGPRDELLAKARGGLVAVVNNPSNREAKAA